MSVNPETLDYTTDILSGLSAVSCVFLFYLVNRIGWHSPATRIIILISFFDLIQALLSLITPFLEANTPNCDTVEFLFTLSMWCSLMWSTSLSILSFRCVQHLNSYNTKKFFTKSLYIVFPICLFISALPFFSFSDLNYEAIQGEVCGIYYQNLSDGFGTFWVILYQSLPLIPAISITFIFYLREIRIVNITIPEEMKRALNLKPERLIWYPLGQLIVYTPQGLLISLMTLSSFEITSLLGFILYVLTRLPGLINTIIYIQINKATVKKALGLNKENILASIDEPGSHYSPEYDDNMP